MWAFREIYEQFPDSELAPQAAFGAMLMAAELGRRDTAADWGEQYLTSFPDHENWPEVATETAKLHAGQGNMPRAVELALEVIERAGTAGSPNLAEARYVAGYGLLSRGEPDQAREHLAAIKQNHSDRTDVREESDYWLGMTHLLSLNPDIAQALEVFQQYVKEFPEGPNVQDARYRVGACLFALNQLEEARGILERLLEQGLTPDQREDVLLMLGDIEYAANNAAQAEAYYRELYTTSEVPERRSHAAFRLGNILESQGEWAPALEFYLAYLEEGGVEPIRAQWRIANCLRELDRIEEMRETLRQAIAEQGNDPNQIIVGLMVEDLLEQNREEALPWIQQQYQQAQEQGRAVLAERLRVVLAREDVGDMTLPEQIDAGNAAPEVLLAKVRSRETDAARADELTDVLEQRLLEEPPEIGNTWLLPAWHAEAQRARDAGNIDEALRILDRIVSMGPTSTIAGEAMRDMGDILLQQERYQEARDAFQSILSVREWKGPLWAEALYKIGMVYLAEDQPQEAFAFFQRTYVLYSAYKEWAARAYLRSGQALEALGLDGQAAQTYREFLEQDQYKGMTQYLEAERRLEQL
jgi:TolA-binding protein